MRILKSVAIAATLVLASVSAAQTPKPVRTQWGLVQGVNENGLTVYKGIPFGAPPVGDLRWRAPQPPAPWKGVRTADKFGPACMQNPAGGRALGLEQLEVSEDCLYLNVWTPAKSPKDRLPVMVWIYGGGFSLGSTSYKQFDGGNIAKRGVVVVSVAYRVGKFGFFAHPELSAEQGGHSGNYGLMDQIAGLQWVKKNIAAFGGNPRRVTIFGESAGGISVSMLAASPLTKGLYQGAISESGGAFTPPRYANEGGESTPPLSVAEQNGKDLLSKIGVASIADARKIPADELMKKSSQSPGGSWPVFDGYALPGDQYKLYETGKYNDTPILVGTNADEGAAFVRTANAAGFTANIRSGYGDFADKILAVYPAGTEAEALRSSQDLVRDTLFAWNTWTWARLQAQTGKSKVFVYYFSHQPPYPDTPQFKGWGAAHAGELGYVFGQFGASMKPTADDFALSDQVESYWTNFAKTGDPNGAGLPAWPAFTNANQQVMDLDDPSHAIPVPNMDKYKVLDAYYAWRRSQADAKH